MRICRAFFRLPKIGMFFFLALKARKCRSFDLVSVWLQFLKKDQNVRTIFGEFCKKNFLYCKKKFVFGVPVKYLRRRSEVFARVVTSQCIANY